jgi:peptide/nickel transport system permease protein
MEEAKIDMATYIARRVLSMIPVLLIVMGLSFLFVRLIPGDPAKLMLGPEATLEQVEDLRHQLGLDEPLPTQFVSYFGRIFSGNLGTSIMYREPIVKLILKRAETSCMLAVLAMVVVICLGVPAGIVAALKAGTWIDQALLFVAMLGISIPAFWLGLLVMAFFAVSLHWFPSSGFPSILASGDWTHLRYLVLPAVTLGYRDSALVARITRSCMLEAMREDYIATARSKGLPERSVILKHALRNAALPVMTILSLSFAALVAGTVVTESVFALPGVGRLMIEAVLGRDYPLLQGLMLVFAGLYLVVNLITDLLYAVLDPRIQYQ